LSLCYWWDIELPDISHDKYMYNISRWRGRGVRAFLKIQIICL